LATRVLQRRARDTAEQHSALPASMMHSWNLGTFDAVDARISLLDAACSRVIGTGLTDGDCLTFEHVKPLELCCLNERRKKT